MGAFFSPPPPPPVPWCRDGELTCELTGGVCMSLIGSGSLWRTKNRIYWQWSTEINSSLSNNNKPNGETIEKHWPIINHSNNMEPSLLFVCFSRILPFPNTTKNNYLHCDVFSNDADIMFPSLQQLKIYILLSKGLQPYTPRYTSHY